uniref:Sorting nexin 20 n=1 Tax=Ailuropoda melanoleuca TaxID=9646 RepID=A0A7N5JGS0_AILME
MASPEHPGSPGWTGPKAKCMAWTKQEASADGRDHPCPGPEGHLDAQGSPSPNSSMTTAELQEYWRKEKRCWRRVKLLFEVASARIEERNVCKFVMGSRPGEGTPSRSHETETAPGDLGCPHPRHTVW